MKDIDKLLKEAETGKTSSVLERITDEATPFWNGIEDMVKLGKKPRPYVVSRLLRDFCYTYMEIHLHAGSYVTRRTEGMNEQSFQSSSKGSQVDL